MRILVLAPQPFFTQRGTPIAVRMLVETLGTRGDEIDLMVYPEGEDVALPNTRLFRVPAMPGTRGIGPGFSFKKLISDAVLAPMAAWRLLRGRDGQRYDLMIAVEESAFIARALKPIFGVPYIFDVDSSIPEQMNDKRELPRWFYRFLVWLERGTARGAVGAIACCEALSDLIRGYAPDLPVQTLEDITMLAPDGGDPTPEDCRFEEPVIMYVGNLEPYQGLGLLLEGFAKLERGISARLVVIGGSATHISEYKARAEKLGVAELVSFLGPRPVERLGDYLRAANIVASPRTQGRNTPMKVYSYLDCGRPLIATRLPTHTQVLTDDVAMLVDPNADDMARGLRELLTDQTRAEGLATAAKDLVQAEFCRDAYERKLTQFLTAEIAPRLPRPPAPPVLPVSEPAK